jgi:hypothetical protein
MKPAQRERKARDRRFEGRFSTILVSIIVVMMLAALALLLWNRLSIPVKPTDYEGVIVDRWAGYAESQYGSSPRLALVIESTGGKRFTVGVDPNVYESARVGMKIKSRSGQIVLIEPGASPGN